MGSAPHNVSREPEIEGFLRQLAVQISGFYQLPLHLFEPRYRAMVDRFHAALA